MLKNATIYTKRFNYHNFSLTNNTSSLKSAINFAIILLFAHLLRHLKPFQIKVCALCAELEFDEIAVGRILQFKGILFPTLPRLRQKNAIGVDSFVLEIAVNKLRRVVFRINDAESALPIASILQDIRPGLESIPLASATPIQIAHGYLVKGAVKLATETFF